MKKFSLLVLLLSIQYYSYSQSPGGISSEIQLWLKADAGAYKIGTTTLAIDGDSIQTWVDQSGARTNNATQGNGLGTPTFRNNTTDNINYNPVLEFDGLFDGLNFGNDYIFSSGTGSQDGITVLVVAKPDPSTLKANQFVFDFGGHGGGGYGGIYSDDRLKIFSPTVFDNTSDASTHFMQNDNFQTAVVRYIWNFTFPRQEISLNSNRFNFFFIDNTTPQLTAAEINENQNHNSTANGGPVSIGRQSKRASFSPGAGSTTRAFDGKIAEVIAYSQDINGPDVWTVESYLMIKYGITMRTNNSHEANTGDYLASNATRIWDSQAFDFNYRYNIIGIGRDDVSALYQKQSHTPSDSIRVYLGTIATTNIDNPNTFSNDISYIVVGDDNAAIHSNGSEEMPFGIYSRLDREWKVTNTNFIDSFVWDVTLDAEAQNVDFTASDLRLLVDTDGDFTDATLYASGDAGLSISYNAGVVTISGISNAIIPLNQTRYLTIASFDIRTPLESQSLLFSARRILEKEIQLNWITTNEQGNTGFEIEMSEDGQNFQVVGFVEGRGNSVIIHSYHFNIDCLEAAYFRLKQIKVNGSYQYSTTIYVPESKINRNLKITPNPTRGNAYLSLGINPPVNEIFYLTLLDMTGKTVEQIRGNWQQIQTSLNKTLNKLNRGAYVVEIQHQMGKYSGKIVLE